MSGPGQPVPGAGPARKQVRAPVDVYMGQAPASMLASSLRRERAVITVCPGVLGLAEVLLCEDGPGHRDADWTALAARRSGAR